MMAHSSQINSENGVLYVPDRREKVGRAKKVIEIPPATPGSESALLSPQSSKLPLAVFVADLSKAITACSVVVVYDHQCDPVAIFLDELGRAFKRCVYFTINSSMLVLAFW